MNTRRRWIAVALVLWAGALAVYLGYRAGRGKAQEAARLPVEAGPADADPLAAAPLVGEKDCLVGRIALRLDKETWEEGEEITGKVWFEVDWPASATNRDQALCRAYPSLSVGLDRQCFHPTVELDLTLPQTVWIRNRYEIAFRVRAEPTLRDLAAAGKKRIVAVPAGAHSIRVGIGTNDPNQVGPWSSNPFSHPPVESPFGLATHWQNFDVSAKAGVQPSQDDVLGWFAKEDVATWPKVLEYYIHRQFDTPALTKSLEHLFTPAPEVIDIREGRGSPFDSNPAHISFHYLFAPGQQFSLRNNGKCMHNAHLICDKDPEFNEAINPGAPPLNLRAPRHEGLYMLKCDVHAATPLGWLLVVQK